MTIRRILVVGAPRSGTTLVQSVLAAHPDVTSFTESHFFDKAWGAGGRRFRPREASQRLADFVAANGLESLREEMPALAAARTVASPLVTGRAFLDLLDAAAVARRCTCWVEKTPDHVLRLDLLRQMDASLRFVHVVRRPADAIASLHVATRRWGHPRSWLRCALHWRLAVAATRGVLANPRHTVVMYERITADPEAEARRLIQWIGLPWRDEVLTQYRTAARELVGDEESWKSRNLQEIAPRAERPLATLPWTARAALTGATAYEAISRFDGQESRE